MKTTRIALYKILRKMGIQRNAINGNANLTMDLYFDEQDMNIFFFFLENKFNVSIKEDEAVAIYTIDDAISFIDRSIN